MYKRLQLLSAVVVILATTMPGASGQNHSLGNSPRNSGASRDAAFVVPANTSIPLKLMNSINSHTAYVGQPIYCETIYPISSGNRILIPVGTYVKGQVTQVKRPGHVKGKAELGLRFDSLTFADGVTRSLRATLSGFGGNGKEGFRRDESKIEGESSKGHDVETVAVTGAEGATIGAIARRGEGAAIGGGSGALGGLVWVLASRGKEIVLPAGTNLELELTAPLDLSQTQVLTPSNSPDGPAISPRDPGPGL